MTKFEIWNDLCKQTKQAKKERDNKRSALMTCTWSIKPEDKQSCIKISHVESPLDTSADGNVNMNFAIHYCEHFSDCKVCTQVDCPKNKANMEYIESACVYKALKRTRNKAFLDMFTRSK